MPVPAGTGWTPAYRFLVGTAVTILGGTFGFLALLLAAATPPASFCAAGIAGGLAVGSLEGRMEGRRVAREVEARGEMESTWLHPHPAFGLLTVLLIVAVLVTIWFRAAGPVVALVGLLGGLGGARAALVAAGLHKYEVRSARTVTVARGALGWTYRVEPSPPGATGKV